VVTRIILVILMKEHFGENAYLPGGSH